jgi:uncharacterized protein YbcI
MSDLLIRGAEQAGPTPDDVRRARGATRAEICRETVRVYTEYFGHGPTKARTIFGDDHVLVILRESFTPSERILVESGSFQAVRSNREAFRDVVEPLLRLVVERATGREVGHFFGQIDRDGVIVLVYLLGPPHLG